MNRAKEEKGNQTAGEIPVMGTVDSRIAEQVQRLLLGSPVSRAFGIELIGLEVDRAVLGLPFKPGNVTVKDIVHGGVIAALIDVAGVAAALSGASFETLRGSATSALSISYLAPARSVALRADAVVLRRGRRQVVIDVSVAAGSLAVAKALVTAALF
ncbi:MAG TPA: PaaI family thioesterase [Beijerinckiaceae bacterium]|nr:PaaI family thioesterase [Beijerinckiaceae bacterium]